VIDFFDDLDDEFPLGDGTADTDGVVICPYCGEQNVIALDPGQWRGTGLRRGLPGVLPAVARPRALRCSRRRISDGRAGAV